MISIFEGKKRVLGKGEEEGVWVQLDTNFKKYIHHFRDCKLHIFLAIALHTDKNGRSFPSYDTICRLTGYGRQTVSNALKELCEMRINGYRVLERRQIKMDNNKFGNNLYIIFPDDEPHMDGPNTENPYTEEPYYNYNHGLNQNYIKPDSECEISDKKQTPSTETDGLLEEHFPNISTPRGLTSKDKMNIITDHILEHYPKTILHRGKARKSIRNLLVEEGHSFYRIIHSTMKFNDYIQNQDVKQERYIPNPEKFYGEDGWKEKTFDTWKPLTDKEYQEEVETPDWLKKHSTKKDKYSELRLKEYQERNK